jgi:hypothetical protein
MSPEIKLQLEEDMNYVDSSDEENFGEVEGLDLVEDDYDWGYDDDYDYFERDYDDWRDYAGY